MAVIPEPAAPRPQGRYLAPALLLLRISTVGFFLAHAIVRLTNGTIPQFAHYLAGKGLPFPTGLVWGITAFEIGGGLLLAAGYAVRPLAAGFITLLLIGIGLIHAAQGWFVGEHGSGGIEYSACLIVCLVVIMAAAEPKPRTPPPTPS